MAASHPSTSFAGRPGDPGGASGSGRRSSSLSDQPPPPAQPSNKGPSSVSLASGPAGEGRAKRVSQPPGKKGPSRLASTGMAAGGGDDGLEVQSSPVAPSCLACRARKTKCNGVEPACNHCIRTGGTCEYVASRRGGSLPKKDRKPKADQERSSSSALSRARPVSDQPAHDNLGEHRLLSIPSSEIVDVRALSLLDTDDDPMDGIETLAAQLQNFLDSLRADSEPAGTILSSSTAQRSDSTSPAAAWENDDRRVRCFPNGESILAAYYAEIYPFEPLLPPPSVIASQTLLATLSSPSPAAPHIPTSPLLLALLGALVLVPAPDDPDPRSAGSKLARQQASQRFVKESERQLEALMAQRGSSEASLEVVQTLSIAGLYHWAQEGSVSKMRARQAQALQLAMDLGLHLSDAHLVFAPEDEWKRDMRRRTFWLTLARVLIGAMLANRPPDLPPYDPRITAEYPTCSADSQAWSAQIDALRYSAYARDFIDQLASSPGFVPTGPHALFGSAPQSGALTKDDRDREFERLDRVLTGLIRNSEDKIGLFDSRTHVSVTGPLDPEVMLCATFRRSALMCQTMTLVDLHRKSALNQGDIGVFTKRLCGLPAISDTPAGARIDKMFASVTAISSPSTTVSPSLSSATQPSTRPVSVASSLPTPPTRQRPGYVQQGFDDLLADALTSWSPPPLEDDPSVTLASTPASKRLAAAPVGWPDLPDWAGSGAERSEDERMALAGPFEPQHSLARVRAGVEAIARLEVLNEALAVSIHPTAKPTLPFCACELISAAYGLLLLALSLQSSDPVVMGEAAVRRELQGIWASCWILLRGLRGYGVVWDGLDAFADELQAALNASLALSGEPARIWD